jgi:hypothetical protein
MRTQREGNKKVIITEGDVWTVSTYIIENDIIQDLDHVTFYEEKDCVNYVCNFFLNDIIKKD